ncbi:MAG: hypothetical protein JEZ12_19680 [Desulfobacterium sp.]|nr:hypothetical protein [Desulfobacterium sp.]
MAGAIVQTKTRRAGDASAMSARWWTGQEMNPGQRTGAKQLFSRIFPQIDDHAFGDAYDFH